MEQNFSPTFDQFYQVLSGLREEVKGLRASLEALLPNRNNALQGSTSVSNIYVHKLCDMDRACEITQKAKSTLYAIARRGDMPCIKKGKSWYFYEDELAEWVEQGRCCYNSLNSNELLREIQSGIHHKPKSIRM